MGLLVRTRVTPRALKTQVGGAWIGAGGEPRLVVRVRAPAENGKANAAAIETIADAFSLPKSAVRITAGPTSRLKSFFLEGDAKSLAERLGRLLNE